MEPFLGLTNKILTEKEFIEKFVDDMLVVSESVQKPSIEAVADELNYYFGIVPGGASYDPNHCLVYCNSDVTASEWNTDFDSIDMQMFWRNFISDPIHVDVSLPDPSSFPQNQHFDYNTFVDGKLINESQLTVNGTVINVAEVLNENVVKLSLNNNTNLIVSATLDIYACLKLSRGSGLLIAPRKVASASVIGNTATIQYDGSAIYYIDTNKYSTDDFYWRFSLLINCVQPIQDATLTLNGVQYTMNLNSQGDFATSFAIDVDEPISFITGLDNIDIDFTLGSFELKTLELSGCTIAVKRDAKTEVDVPISNNLTYRSSYSTEIQFYTPNQWVQTTDDPIPTLIIGDLIINDNGTAFKIVFTKRDLSGMLAGNYLMRVSVPVTISNLKSFVYMVFQVEIYDDGEISLRDRECFIELSQYPNEQITIQNTGYINVRANHSNMINGVLEVNGMDLGNSNPIYLNQFPRLINRVGLTFGSRAKLYTGTSLYDSLMGEYLGLYAGTLLHQNFTPTIFDIVNKIINKQLKFRIAPLV